METIKIDGITIEYSTADGIRYCCYIKEQDVYFSSKIEKGTEYIIRLLLSPFSAQMPLIIAMPTPTSFPEIAGSVFAAK